MGFHQLEPAGVTREAPPLAELVRALGVDVLTTTSNVSMEPRLDAYARKTKIRVGLHNHSRMAADELATPQDLEAAMLNAFEYMGVNLDVGHFTAAGFDPVGFIEKQQRIVSLHLKDRKKNQGDDCNFGERGTPVCEIPVRECLAYCRKVLA